MITLRDASPSDIQGILDIINWAIENTNAYWRFSPETFNERQHWYESRLSEGRPVIVATDNTNQVIGFGSYGEFRSPPGNKGCVEHSVYVRHDAHGRGVGGKLLDTLIRRAQTDPNLHSLVGCVDGDNPASDRLHKSRGFEMQGFLKGVARKNNTKRDLAIYVLDV